MLIVKNFYEEYTKELFLELLTGKSGLEKRIIKIPEIHRAGLSLTGNLQSYYEKRVLIIGEVEIEYLALLDSKTRKERLSAILSDETPFVVLSRKYCPPKELIELCEERQMPLFKTSLSTMTFTNKVAMILTDKLARTLSKHGTFVEVFDIGVIIEGDSSIGKSEAALGLIERGHRLISDDIVQVKKLKGSILEGYGIDLTRHHMEIRGIGIINVANLYGAFCVRDRKKIDLVVKLEEWDDDAVYDRVGSEEKTCELLGVQVPFSILPVKPGRDLVLLIEAIALNFRLKKMGYHSAREFKSKLSRNILENQSKFTSLSSPVIQPRFK